MPTLSSPLPFREALQDVARRRALPTTLGSRELRELDAAVRRQSLFSARTTMEHYLEDIRAVVNDVLNPRTVERDGRPVTEGINPAEAREILRDKLREYGYSPDPAERGTLKDLSSDARINLVVKTNVQMAQGLGQTIQGNDPDALDAFPAYELTRFEDRDKERDWGARWLAAAQASGDDDAVRVYGETQRLVARKDSPIWDSLGAGAGGYEDDALGNPYEPFAFNSGMGRLEIEREECVALGLIGETEQIEPVDISALIEGFGREEVAA